MSVWAIPDLALEPMIRIALLEDFGTGGDVTSRAVIPPGRHYEAYLNARQDGVVSGMQVAEVIFRLVNPSLRLETLISDGAHCTKGDTLMKIGGEAASILAAERVVLNFVGRMTGIATQTSQFVARAEGTTARITCTRKTTPGLRLFEKLAVLHGGGFNHRFSLSDAILIKDNHIAAAGSVREALEAAKRHAGHMVVIEVEIDNLDQLCDVLSAEGASAVLFDNMSNEDMAEAVKRINGRMQTEASGNVTLSRVQEIARTGVDYISAGALTHSVRTADIGLDF